MKCYFCGKHIIGEDEDAIDGEHIVYVGQLCEKCLDDVIKNKIN